MATAKHDTPPILISFQRCAALLGVSETTIRRRVDDGTLPAVRLGDEPGSAVRIVLSELVRQIERAGAVDESGDAVHPTVNTEAEVEAELEHMRAEIRRQMTPPSAAERLASERRVEIANRVNARLSSSAGYAQGVDAATLAALERQVAAQVDAQIKAGTFRLTDPSAPPVIRVP